MQTSTTYLFILLLFPAFFNSDASTPDSNDFFTKEIETLSYEVYYNYGFIQVNVGQFKLTTNTINFNGERCYYFQSSSETAQNWKWFYDLKSTHSVVSSVSRLHPIKYNQIIEHGKSKTTYEYTFDSDSISIDSFIEGESSKTKLKNGKSVYDALTAVHYARSLDFSNFKSGDSLQIKVLHDDEFVNQKIFYDGTVDLIDETGETSECHKFSSIIKNNDIISASEAAEVWVSTDERRLPLKIIVKIAVGRVEIKLMN